MDKRLSLALLLTAAVVAVTPILFPTARRIDTTRVAAPRDSVRGLGSLSEMPARETISRASPSMAAASVPDPTSVVGFSARLEMELTTLNIGSLVYQFSNIGAAPVSAVMQEYKNLAPSGGQVELKVPGKSLITYSLVTRSDTIQLSRIPFQLNRSQNGVNEILTYQASVNGLGVTITYEVIPDRYLMHVRGRIDGVVMPRYLLMDLPSSLPPAESDTLGDLRTLAYSFKPVHENARGVAFEKLDPGEKRLEPGPLTWAAIRNKYFVIGLINPEGSLFDEITLTGGARTSKIATTASATVVKAIAKSTFAFDMYIGPQQSTALLAVGRDFDNVNPYGWSPLQGVVNPIAALCIKLLLWMHQTLNLSYGWVLVIFGVLVRIALWPLNQSAMRSSLKMQEIQPRLADVQKKYKDKPEKQREEMMRVYKEAGASPFTALSGCLPALIPMPVLFALFFVFQNTIEFRGVSFMWLTDISIKDPLYILPVLMGASMYVLSWIGLRNAPPNPQAKMMGYMFPVMMTFVLANMASGLNLYYTAQNIAALPQQWLLAKERARARRLA